MEKTKRQLNFKLLAMFVAGVLFSTFCVFAQNNGPTEDSVVISTNFAARSDLTLANKVKLGTDQAGVEISANGDLCFADIGTSESKKCTNMSDVVQVSEKLENLERETAIAKNGDECDEANEGKIYYNRNDENRGNLSVCRFDGKDWNLETILLSESMELTSTDP